MKEEVEHNSFEEGERILILSDQVGLREETEYLEMKNIIGKFIIKKINIFVKSNVSFLLPLCLFFSFKYLIYPEFNLV